MTLGSSLEGLIVLSNGAVAGFITAVLFCVLAIKVAPKSAQVAKRLTLVGLCCVPVVFGFATLGTFHSAPALISLKATEGAIKSASRPQVELKPDAINSGSISIPSPVKAKQTTLSLTLPYDKILVGLWLLASAWILVRRHVGKRRLRRCLTPLDSSSQSFHLINGLLSTHERLSIGLLTSEAATPFVFHSRGAKIVLPYAIVNLPGKESKAAILHELAHIRKFHLIEAELAVTINAFFGWIPLVPALGRQLRMLQEIEADDMVAAELGEGKSLARAIVHFSSLPSPVKLAWAHLLVTAGPSLERRVLRLINQDRSNMTIPRIAQVSLLVAASAAAFGSTLLVKFNLEQKALPKHTLKLMNWAVGNEWRYETTYMDGSVVPQTVYANGESQAGKGTTFEYLLYGKTLKGQDTISYSYMTGTPAGLHLTEKKSYAGDARGAGAIEAGPIIPSAPEVKNWKWSEAYSGVQTSTAPGNKSPIPATEFQGKLISTNAEVDTPLGKKKAWVYEVREQVSWDIRIKTTWYVEGLGKVREDLTFPTGQLIGRTILKEFKRNQPAREMPQYIDTRRPGA